MLRYRTAPPVIVELFSVAKAMLAPDRLGKLLGVSPYQRIRRRRIDFPQQRTGPACQLQALLHLHGVTAIGGLELLDRGHLAIKSRRDVNRAELRGVMATFPRPVGPLRRVIVCLGDGSRR